MWTSTEKMRAPLSCWTSSDPEKFHLFPDWPSVRLKVIHPNTDSEVRQTLAHTPNTWADVGMNVTPRHTFAHTQASGGSASPSQCHCQHVNLNKHPEPIVSICILVVNPDQEEHPSFPSLTDSWAGSCWVTVQQHILWPLCWLLRYTLERIVFHYLE